ncbi:hypothetical protein KIN20_030352 [Parelaphostrongylus tenuis]|uniref:Uncharacterized protein n=1 Tax=Parelaphostrongylus tenuis TaxID=148309 RepID=A0AAD5WG31_PARTN|nr:hypothetical protein KIN20_030352 [Parelaphostrongylus tenuis]
MTSFLTFVMTALGCGVMPAGQGQTNVFGDKNYDELEDDVTLTKIGSKNSQSRKYRAPQ